MARRKTSHSEKIRQYFSQHPEASAGEVAKALKVKPALVYNVRSAMRGPGKRKRGRRKRASAMEANGSMKQVTAAAKLIRDCGGVAEAKAALRAAEAVAAALEG